MGCSDKLRFIAISKQILTVTEDLHATIVLLGDRSFLSIERIGYYPSLYAKMDCKASRYSHGARIASVPTSQGLGNVSPSYPLLLLLKHEICGYSHCYTGGPLGHLLDIFRYCSDVPLTAMSHMESLIQYFVQWSISKRCYSFQSGTYQALPPSNRRTKWMVHSFWIP